MSFNLKSPLFYVTAILAVVILLRFVSGGNDFSYFIVAGSDFVDSNSNPIIKTVDGPGYDGQFFYHYALDPSGSKATGITVDHPAYRHQRVVYPILAWLISFGNPAGIPFALVMINFLSIITLTFILMKICSFFKVSKWWSIMPAFFGGILMALGRDLAEPLEALFFISALYFLLKDEFWLYILASTLCIFTREPSAILILPISLIWSLKFVKTKSFLKSVSAILPFGFFLLWKIFLFQYHDSTEFIEGGNNFSLPFEGLIQGFTAQLSESKSIFDYAEIAVWALYLFWNIWLIALTIQSVRSPLIDARIKWSWNVGLIFAILFSYSIYVDDWSFARVLTSFNTLSFLVLIMSKRLPSKPFIFFTAAIALMTISRLMIRP